MPLIAQYTGIKDWENVVLVDPETDRREKQETVNIVFATMCIGMNKITDENAAEFFARCQMLDLGISADTVREHVGMTTNVSPMTSAAFTKHAMKIWETEFNRPPRSTD